MIKIKIIKNNNFETLLQVNNKEIINMDQNIEKGENDFRSVCYLINDKGFGVLLRPILVSFKPIDKTEYNYHFIDDSDNDDVINTVDNDSVFLKQDSYHNDDNGETSILEIPMINKLSSTSSEEN